MKKSRYEYPVPEQQADATLNQATPVSGTQYEVLATTRNCRIITIAVRCTWTVQPTPLEIWITIDGVTERHYFTDPVSDTAYYVGNEQPFVAENNMATAPHVHRAFYEEGRSVKIEAEITGGTVSNLSARVKYARW